jgi:hypothetical protein
MALLLKLVNGVLDSGALLRALEGMQTGSKRWRSCPMASGRYRARRITL